MADTREQLTPKIRVILEVIIANPGAIAAEIATKSIHTMASISGAIVWLMYEGLVLRAYGTRPPCTYWATQKAVEMFAEDTADEDEEDT